MIWLNWSHYLFLMADQLVIFIGCIIFLSPFIDVTIASASLAECFPLTYNLSGFRYKANRVTFTYHLIPFAPIFYPFYWPLYSSAIILQTPRIMLSLVYPFSIPSSSKKVAFYSISRTVLWCKLDYAYFKISNISQFFKTLNHKSFGNLWGNSYVLCLLLITMPRLTCG